MTHLAAILDRYARCWSPPRATVAIDLPGVQIAELEAEGGLAHATVGLGVELYLVARGGPPLADSADLLAVVARHHRASPLAVDHTVGFGRPWQPGSRCSHALVAAAPPALPGVLRLVPVTRHEVAYLTSHGAAALAARFADAAADLLDPRRASVV